MCGARWMMVVTCASRTLTLEGEGSTAFRERNSSSGQNSRNGTLWVILSGGGMVTDEAQCDESLARTIVRTQVGVIIPGAKMGC